MRKRCACALIALALVVLPVVSAFAAELPTPEPAPGEVEQKATSILNQSQFAPAKKSLTERALNWLWRKIKVPFTKAAGGNTLIGYIILAGFIAALVFVLSRLRFRLPQSIDNEDRGPEVELTENRSAAMWLQEAEQFEAQQAWKDALRARYRWLLAQLIEEHTLVNVPGRTPGEYRDEFARIAPAPAAAFAAATDLFELAWYGNEPTGAEENRRFRAHAEQVLRATVHHRSVPA
jgi:hypothetical protein